MLCIVIWVKLKIIAINRENDQSMFHAPVTQHIFFSGPLHSEKLKDLQSLEGSNWYQGNKNAVL